MVLFNRIATALIGFCLAMLGLAALTGIWTATVRDVASFALIGVGLCLLNVVPDRSE